VLPLPPHQIEILWEPGTRRRFVANSRILQREVNVRLAGQNWRGARATERGGSEAAAGGCVAPLLRAAPQFERYLGLTILSGSMRTTT
jgi:hypothetical protein